MREELIGRLGRWPERAAPGLELGAAEDAGGCTRRLARYDAEPGERVSAWLLEPEGAAPAGGRPAILALHQHAGQYHLGKAEPAGLAGDPMYFYGLELARRGYAVLCPDHLCFEERRPAGEGALDGPAFERFEFTRRVALGSCLQTKYLHDMVAALDVLCALPGVDAGRVGAIGHSLGGQETLWLTWLDRRVRAGVSSCGFGTLETIFRDRINHNMAMYVPGMLEVGDVDSLASGIAPRPFMLTAGEADGIFPVDGVRRLAARAAEAYAAQGCAERFEAVIFPGGHSFPPEVRERAYSFLDRWVAGG